jgi:hypothetical protein
MKRSEEVMEILEAYDVTGSLRGAAALAGCDHKTVAHWVRAREEAGGGLPPASRAQRPQGAVEPRHRPVAERLHHPPAGGGDHPGHVFNVGATNPLHAIVPEPREQRGRIDQVAEDNDRHTTHTTSPLQRRPETADDPL